MNFFNIFRRKEKVNNNKLSRTKVVNNKKKTEAVECVKLNVQKKPEGKMIMDNPLIKLTEIELRDLCRHHIDTFENWSRRIIDELFKTCYGADYFNYMLSKEQPLIKSEIKKRIEQRVKDNPRRFPRKIDAILIEDIEYFFCREDLYCDHFKAILEPFYSGVAEVRKVLERLIPIRNKLSHGNTISLHEAEQCICYIGDFIEVYKTYYLAIGKEKDYNVPIFLRIKDNLGNDFIREHTNDMWEMNFWGIMAPKIQLRSGESYKLWVEVDSSFDSSFYDIKWVVKRSYSKMIKKGTGSVIEFSLDNKDVSYRPEIHIFLVTKRDWHRFHEADDIIKLTYEKVLPPIEDTY